MDPASRRRVYRALALALGVLGILGPVELACYLVPARHHLDNPFYSLACQGKGLLRFQRPAGISWTGLSRGDLLFPEEHDPYARPVAFETDGLGFRNDADADAAAADVVFLGDSFTEAGNVPAADTFALRVQGALGCSVRNLGRAGYSAPSEFVVLREFGVGFQPRAVVWQLYEGNDLVEAANFAAWVARGCPDLRVAPHELPTRFEAWTRRSPTRALIRRLTPRERWSPAGVFVDSQGREHEVRFTGVQSQAPAGHPGWPSIQQALGAGAKLLSDRGVPLVVLFLPRKAAVFHGVLRSPEGSSKDAPPSTALASALRETCARLGVDFVDATGPLTRALEQGNLVYVPTDSHLSPAGHELIAGLLSERLRPRLGGE